MGAWQQIERVLQLRVVMTEKLVKINLMSRPRSRSWQQSRVGELFADSLGCNQDLRYSDKWGWVGKLNLFHLKLDVGKQRVPVTI